MTELQEKTRRERMQQLGEEWVRAITEGTLERLEQLCHPDVSSRLLTPKNFFRYETAGELISKYRQWFGDCGSFHIEHQRIETVGERLGISFRLLLLEEGTHYIVEQQLYCTLQGDCIASLQALCSGFHRVVENRISPGLALAEDVHLQADALLEVHTGAESSGSTCALLTPAIKARLREMQSGQVLEVRVDDASAKGDIEAWSRLSGNELLMMAEGAGAALRFLVKKK